MPDRVDRMPDKDIEYFGSVQEIAQEDDRVETDVHIIGWEKKLRIRALSFEDMDKINRFSKVRKKDEKEQREVGDLDQAEWTYWTLVYGVVIPRMTISQARLLADNNGDMVRQLTDEIWNLGRISKKLWNRFMDEQKKLAAMEKTGNPETEDDNESMDE